MSARLAQDSPWLAQGEAKRRAVQAMFAEIAPSYDLLNSLLSVRLHHRWRAAAVRALGLRPGDRALDVCCGTGDFLHPLREAVGSSGSVAGTDFCEPMLRLALKKPRHEAALTLGDACSLPYRDGRFEAVTVGWGLRNVPDLDLALSEAFRVLKPGGRFVSLDMARPRSRLLGRVAEWSFHTLSPALGRLFGNREAYEYLPKSAERFASREEMVSAMERAGFVAVRWRDFYFGNVCMHWGVRP